MTDVSRPAIVAFVQARMSSRRFPGKVLAPFLGLPIVDHVVGAVREALPGVPVVVLTSTARSDDPLAAHLGARGVAFVRGPLDDVLGRFLVGLEAHPATWALRVCADSPVLGAHALAPVVARASSAEAEGADLVTTTHPRTFPKGQNAELIRASTLARLDLRELDADDREHVTRFLHRHPARFRLVNVESGHPDWAELSLAIDTLDDLERLEALAPGVLPAPVEASLARARARGEL